MFRIFALAAAAVGMVGLSAGTANAHPPDLYGSSYASGYSSSYTPSYSTHSSSYYGSPYTQQSYGTTYAAPSYSSASYGSTYAAPSYATSNYTAAPAYRTPSYANVGHSSPSYGYRHRGGKAYHGRRHYRGAPGYARNPYSNYPVTAYSHRSFGPYGDIPSTEGLNVGYAGGPTYGRGDNTVINGVHVNVAPN